MTEGPLGARDQRLSTAEESILFKMAPPKYLTHSDSLCLLKVLYVSINKEHLSAECEVTILTICQKHLRIVSQVHLPNIC